MGAVDRKKKHAHNNHDRCDLTEHGAEGAELPEGN
jgi:hypothetical protein